MNAGSRHMRDIRQWLPRFNHKFELRYYRKGLNMKLIVNITTLNRNILVHSF